MAPKAGSDDVAWIDVLPSMANFGAEAIKQIAGVGTKVGKEFGKELNTAAGTVGKDVAKSLTSGLSAAADAVTAAGKKVATSRAAEKKAAGDLQVAELKLQETREKGNATASATAAAENKVSAAQDKLKIAQKSTSDALGNYSRVTDQAKHSTESAGEAAEEGEGKFSGLKDSFIDTAKEAGGLVLGLLAVQHGAELLGTAIEEQGLGAMLQAQLGEGAEQAEEDGKLAGELYAQGWGDSVQGIDQALVAVVQNMPDFGDATGGLEEVTKDALNMAKVFNVDVATSTQTVAQLLNTGLAKSGAEAFDIITAGMQQGINRSGDFLDSLTSYAAVFQHLGISGAQAVGVFRQGLNAGAKSTSAIGSAIQLFSKNATAQTKSVSTAFKVLGLNGKKVGADIAAGGKPANDALNLVLSQLRTLPASAAKSAAATTLFGKSTAGLGAALSAINPAAAEKGLSDVEGAAGRVGDALASTASQKLSSFGRSIEVNIVELLGAHVVPLLTSAGTWLKGHLGPAIDWVNDRLGDLGDWFRENKPAIDQVLKVIKDLVVALAVGLYNAVKGAVTGLIAMGTWINNNRGWIIPLAIGIGALAVPFAALAIAQGIAALAVAAWGIATTVATGIGVFFTGVVDGITVAWRVFNLVLQTNPLFLIISVIVALVAVFIYLWKTSAGFRGFWIGLWNDIKKITGVVVAALVAAFHAVVGAFVDVWHALEAAWDAVSGAVMTAVHAVQGAFEVAGAAIMVAVNAVGAAFVWLWKTILSPIFNVISIAVRILVAIIVTVLVTPIYLAVKLLGYIFGWLWKNAINPAFDAIGAAATAVWNGVLRPIFNAIGVASRAVGAAFVWLFNSVVRPIFTAMGVAARAVGAAFVWLWVNAIQPAINAIHAGEVWLYNTAIKPVFDAIVVAVHAVGAVFTWLWDHSIGWLINLVASHIGTIVLVMQATNARVGTILHAIGAVFTWLWDHSIGWLINQVSSHWGQVLAVFARAQVILTGILKDVGGWFVWLWNHSIGWLIGKIEDGFGSAVKAIQKVWDTIKGIVAAPINFIINTVYNGGIVPVWNFVVGAVGLNNLKLDKAAPIKLAGGGVFPGYAPGVDSIPAMVSPGEAVLVPELVRAIGPRNILALNDQFSGGRPGTVMGASGGAVPHFAGGGVVSDVLSFAGDIGKKVAGLFTDPIGTLTRAIGKGGNWLTAAAHVPSTLISDAVGWLGKQITNLSAPHDPGEPGSITAKAAAILNRAIQLTGAAPHDAWFNGMNTLIWRESSWNPNAVNLTDSNAKAGHPSRGLAQTIPSTFETYRLLSLPDNIVDPVANVVAAIRYIMNRYHSISNVQQANPNLPPKGYDHGGPLGTGFTPIWNGTGDNETILPFTPTELKGILGGDGGSANEYQLVEGELRIAEDGLNAFVTGKMRKSNTGSRRVLNAGTRH